MVQQGCCMLVESDMPHFNMETGNFGEKKLNFDTKWSNRLSRVKLSEIMGGEGGRVKIRWKDGSLLHYADTHALNIV